MIGVSSGVRKIFVCHCEYRPARRDRTKQSHEIATAQGPRDDSQTVGCDQCRNTGYKGRVAIAELLVPNRAVEDLIVAQGSSAAFADAAQEAGMQTIAADGFAKAQAGLTTVAEIERVTGRASTPGLTK